MLRSIHSAITMFFIATVLSIVGLSISPHASEARFISADWWNPLKAGVGINRYSYSFNDPVNRFDPDGNADSWAIDSDNPVVDRDGNVDYVDDDGDRGALEGEAWSAEQKDEFYESYLDKDKFNRDVQRNRQKALAKGRERGALTDELEAARANIDLMPIVDLTPAGTVVAIGGVGVAINEGNPAQAGIAAAGIIPGGKSLTRVGRWMGKKELDKLLSSGNVVESTSGATHVASPANAATYGNQALNGSTYVEFDVPSNSLVNTGTGIAQVVTPNSKMAERLGALGRPVSTDPIPAFNIHVGPIK